MNNKLIEDNVFKQLQFTKQWIDLGIINSTNFTELKAKYLKGDDTRSEHYRWVAYRRFIEKNRTSLSIEQMYNLYDLGKNDPSPAMGRSMRFYILELDNCPEELIELECSLKTNASKLGKKL